MAELASHPGDHLLAAAAATGDKMAFATLVERHKHWVLRLVARFFREHALIDDIGQTIFHKAHLGLGTFDGQVSFKSWLYRIAVSVSLDALRQRRKYPVRLVSGERAPRPEASEDWAMEVEEMLRWLDSAMRALEPEEQLAFTLLELEEKSVAEVAGLTGWGKAAVRTRAARAWERLRVMLEAGHGQAQA